MKRRIVAAGVYAPDARLAASHQALCATLLAAAATLHSLCMPGAPDCENHAHPLAVTAKLCATMRSRKYVSSERWAASVTVMGSTCVASNAYAIAQVRTVAAVRCGGRTGYHTFVRIRMVLCV